MRGGGRPRGRGPCARPAPAGARVAPPQRTRRTYPGWKRVSSRCGKHWRGRISKQRVERRTSAARGRRGACTRGRQAASWRDGSRCVDPTGPNGALSEGYGRSSEKKATATPTRNGNAPPSWRGPALQTDVAAVPPDFTRDQRSRRGTALRRATSPQWNSNEMDQASLQRPAKRDAISPSSSVALGDVSVRIDRGPIVSSVSDVAYDVRKTSSCLHVFDVL